MNLGHNWDTTEEKLEKLVVFNSTNVQVSPSLSSENSFIYALLNISASLP